MPTERSHLRQAEHNRVLIETLDPKDPRFLDWIVTAAFYAAVHFIEAWLAGINQHSSTHTDRDEWGGKIKEFQRVEIVVG